MSHASTFPRAKKIASGCSACATTGRGIEAAYQEKVFEPFKRLHGRQYAGSGPGSPASAWLSRWADVSGWNRLPGEGSIFVFTLPERRLMR